MSQENQNFTTTRIPEGGVISDTEKEIFAKFKKGHKVMARVDGGIEECEIVSKNDKNYTLEVDKVYVKRTDTEGKPIHYNVDFRKDVVDPDPYKTNFMEEDA